MGGKIFDVGENDFGKAVETGVTVADFYASWCAPCMMMSGVVENLSEKYNKVNFLKINIENSPNITQEFGISSIPCLIFFKDGKQVDRIDGNVEEDFIETKIKSYIN